MNGGWLMNGECLMNGGWLMNASDFSFNQLIQLAEVMYE